jgi:hypothetical protein
MVPPIETQMLFLKLWLVEAQTPPFTAPKMNPFAAVSALC